jgi:hypothetical protein
LGILEFPFFIFQNFDCKPRYACFSIFLNLKVESLFLHLSLLFYYFFQNKALVLLNPSLLKYLGYHNRFLRYLQKNVDFLTVQFTVGGPFLIFNNFLVFLLQ